MTRLPDEVRRFILTSVSSVPQLEAILLLRSSRDEVWDAGRLAARLYVREAKAASLMQWLQETGVAQARGDGYAYAPHAELADLLDQLAHHYATDLLAITNLIHSHADRRLQEFADAFRVRK